MLCVLYGILLLFVGVASYISEGINDNFLIFFFSNKFPTKLRFPFFFNLHLFHVRDIFRMSITSWLCFFTALLYWRPQIASRKCFLTILFNYYFFIIFLGGNSYFELKLRREDHLDNFYSSVKIGGFYILCGFSHQEWWAVAHLL